VVLFHGDEPLLGCPENNRALTAPAVRIGVPHLLFSGMPGTGKTSAALCIARELLGSNWRNFTLELNASDERGIKMVRERVKNFARYSRSGLAAIPFAIIILDESDQMTSAAQTALRRIMETSSQVCRFILICNYPSKIIEPIQSRCAIFRFAALQKDAVMKHLKHIAQKETLELPDATAESIVEFSEGDLRRAINILHTASMYKAGDVINVNTVLNVVGQANPKQVQIMLTKALNGEFLEARELLYQLMTVHSLSGINIIRQIHRELFKLSYLSPEDKAELTNIMSEYISMEIDLEILDMLIDSAAAGTEYWSAKNNEGINASGTAFDVDLGFFNTQGQWFQTLGTKMQKLSNKIHQLTLRGGANFLVCSPTVATVLESIPGFAYYDGKEDIRDDFLNKMADVLKGTEPVSEEEIAEQERIEEERRKEAEERRISREAKQRKREEGELRDEEEEAQEEKQEESKEAEEEKE